MASSRSTKYRRLSTSPSFTIIKTYQPRPGIILALVLIVLIALTTTLLGLESLSPSNLSRLWSDENSLLNHPYESGIISKTIVQTERLRIKEELKSFNLPKNYLNIDNLIPESGGNPIKALILTTWRSGSTFLGDIALSHPGTYYHYEPLLHYMIKQIRQGDPDVEDAVGHLKKLFKCDYTNMDNYFGYAKHHPEVFSHNRRLYKYCLTTNGGRGGGACRIPELISQLCALYPFQIMKSVRLRVKAALPLIELAQELNLKIILLVRDPRGTMQSRTHRTWCPGNRDCDSAAVLCQDLVSDYEAAEVFLRKFPETFKVLRYEDFSSDPYNKTKELFDFIGFRITPSVKEFLDTHTTQNLGDVSSTYRDSRTAPYHWKQDLPFETVIDIQSGCTEAMDLWGYRKYRHLREVEKLDSVLPLNLTKSYK